MEMGDIYNYPLHPNSFWVLSPVCLLGIGYFVLLCCRYFLPTFFYLFASYLFYLPCSLTPSLSLFLVAYLIAALGGEHKNIYLTLMVIVPS